LSEVGGKNSSRKGSNVTGTQKGVRPGRHLRKRRVANSGRAGVIKRRGLEPETQKEKKPDECL